MGKQKKASKQVKIITIHFGTNHGSALQAYALSEYLTSIGCDCKIIDYVPKRYRIWDSLFCRKRRQYPLIAIVAYYPIAVLKSIRVRKIFEKFLKHNLKLTKRFTNSKKLQANPPKADVYISGSDQVWNNDYNGNDDLSYFLNFVPGEAKRIAYAASFGKESVLEQKYIDDITPLLKTFDSLSVREINAQSILEGWGFSATHVVDPVFLLTREQWKKFANVSKIEEPYTLVYVMDGAYEELLHYAQKIKEERGNKICVICFSKIKDKRIDKCFYLTDPKDFVGLIQNANLVITNSFHGTAFSILLEKDFVTIGKERYNSRMLSLLGKLSMTEHFIHTGADISVERIDAISCRNDIDSVDKELQEWILRSKEFIQHSLEF